jgi:hypothetical protein
MTYRCVLRLGQWNSRWSIDWYSSPQLHAASSNRWNRCKYAFVIPWPVGTAVIFGVSFILDRTLCWIVGKYCLVAAALWLVVNSRCHFCMASSSASLYIVLLGILSKSHFMSVFLAASFAILSAVSLPRMPACALTQEKCMYVCMYVYMYVCMYVRTYVCMYVCMYSPS